MFFSNADTGVELWTCKRGTSQVSSPNTDRFSRLFCATSSVIWIKYNIFFFQNMFPRTYLQPTDKNAEQE